jgi:hypothetical protein
LAVAVKSRQGVTSNHKNLAVRLEGNCCASCDAQEKDFHMAAGAERVVHTAIGVEAGERSASADDWGNCWATAQRLPPCSIACCIMGTF